MKVKLLIDLLRQCDGDQEVLVRKRPYIANDGTIMFKAATPNLSFGASHDEEIILHDADEENEG